MPTFRFDQVLRGRRGVNRTVQVSASRLPARPSIQP
jgi:hypothetical protein